MTGSIPHPLELVSLIILIPLLSCKALPLRPILTLTTIHWQQTKHYIWTRVAAPMLLLDRLQFSGLLSHMMITALLAVSTPYLTAYTHSVLPLYDHRQCPLLCSTEAQHI